MFDYILIRLGFGAAALLSSSEGVTRFHPGFPLSLPTGRALVIGTTMPEDGYTTESVTVRYWQGGSVVHEARAVMNADGTFITVLDGLTPGADYNVVAEVKSFRFGKYQRGASVLATITGR